MTGPVDAERPRGAAHEGRLARAELARDRHDVAGLELPGDRSADALGLLGRGRLQLDHPPSPRTAPDARPRPSSVPSPSSMRASAGSSASALRRIRTSSPSHDSSVLTSVPPSLPGRGARRGPHRSRSSSRPADEARTPRPVRSVDVIVARPAFQRNAAPSAHAALERHRRCTSGFQLGQLFELRSGTSQTVSGIGRDLRLRTPRRQARCGSTSTRASLARTRPEQPSCSSGGAAGLPHGRVVGNWITCASAGATTAPEPARSTGMRAKSSSSVFSIAGV